MLRSSNAPMFGSLSPRCSIFLFRRSERQRIHGSVATALLKNKVRVRFFLNSVRFTTSNTSRSTKRAPVSRRAFLRDISARAHLEGVKLLGYHTLYFMISLDSVFLSD